MYTVAVAAAVPLRILLLFTAVTERNFLTYFFQNNGILQRQNGETATEERQRNGGNRALERMHYAVRSEQNWKNRSRDVLRQVHRRQTRLLCVERWTSRNATDFLNRAIQQ